MENFPDMANKIVFTDKELNFTFKKKVDLYYVEWEDAIAHTGWMSKKESDEWFDEQTMIIKQVGWIVMEEKNYIGMVGRKSEWSEQEEEYGLLQKIPRTWIRRKVKLTKYIK